MAISYYRGLATISLKKKFPKLKGSMMAVGGTKEEIEPLIAALKTEGARIACFNSPSSLTISGDEAAVDELQTVMEKKEIFNRKLVVDVAYHSHHMMKVAKDYRASLDSLDPPRETQVRFHSSLHGELVDSTTLLPSYWVDNLTQPVRFSEALTNMCEPIEGHKTGVNMLIEIGPHSALGGPVKQILKACGGNSMKIPYTSALVRKKDAVETALAMASMLFIKGATLDMGAINLPKRPNKQPTLLVDMPRYPWNHQTKYWHEPRMMQKHKNRSTPRNDLIGTLANYSNEMEPTWRNILRIDDLPWLRHHKIQSLTIFPMSGFLAMAVEAACQRATTRGIEFDEFELRDISVNTPLMVTDEDIEMTIQLRPHQEGTLTSSSTWDEFRIHSWASNKGWTEHCKGLITVRTKEVGSAQIRSDQLLQSSISEIDSAAMTSVEKSEMYDALAELGVSYGPSFQGINNCEASDRCSMANITVVDTKHDMPQAFQTSAVIHPALLEQLIEMYWPILGSGRTSLKTVYLASSIGRMTISRNITAATATPGDSLRAFCKGPVIPSHPKAIQVSMFATATDGQEALVILDDLTIQPILERDMVSESEAHRELCYKLEWEPILEPVDFSMSNGITNGIPKNGVQVNGHTNGTTNGTPKENRTPKSLLETVTIVHGDSEAQKTLTSKLSDALEHFTGVRPEAGLLKDVESEGRLCLFICELDTNLLSSLTKEQFTSLQKLLTTVQGLLWVVRGAYTNSTNPDANMVTGLSRSIRSETLLKFATLDLDAECVLSDDSAVKAILKVLKATFNESAAANCELEFMERNGSFLTPRIVNDPETNAFVHKQTKASVLEPTLFGQEDRPLQMVIGAPGSLDTLHFVDQSREEAMADDEIEIQVKAIGMNPKDVSAAMGHLDTLDFGMECSGLVTKVGKNVFKFEVGNRVAAISTSEGVYSSFTRTKEAFSFKIKDDMSFESGASLPVAFCTAQYGLSDLGRLEKDERVLIHGAESAVGHAAISLAQKIGAEVYISAEKPENGDAISNSYGISSDHILLTSNICQQTEKGYFDVVLNTIATDADMLRDIWASLSSFGRLVEAGQGDVSSRLETSRSEKNKSFLSVDLASMAVERPKILKRLVLEVSDILKDDKATLACPTTTFPISDVETAFKTMQSGNLDGKLIVAPQAGDEVKVRSVLNFLLDICTNSF